MNKATLLGMALGCAVPFLSMAEGDSLEQQLATAKADITAAQQINIELKAQLVDRDRQAAELKLKLKHIQDQIDALKNGQHPESK